MGLYFSRIMNWLIDPQIHLLFLMSAFIFYGIKKKKLYLLQWIFISYFLLVISPLPVILHYLWEKNYPPVVELEKKDAAVILGGGTVVYHPESNQHFYPGPSARVLEALKLYRKGWVRKIVVSGGDPQGVQKGYKGEADSIVILLQNLGVPALDILVERKSLNTYQEALYLKDLLPRWKIRSFYLVTSANHMKRSMECFLNYQLPASPYPVDFKTLQFPSFGSFHLSHLFLLKALMHEWIGLLYYKMLGHA